MIFLNQHVFSSRSHFYLAVLDKLDAELSKALVQIFIRDDESLTAGEGVND